jgi:hypothetical protein
MHRTSVFHCLPLRLTSSRPETSVIAVHTRPRQFAFLDMQGVQGSVVEDSAHAYVHACRARTVHGQSASHPEPMFQVWSLAGLHFKKRDRSLFFDFATRFSTFLDRESRAAWKEVFWLQSPQPALLLLGDDRPTSIGFFLPPAAGRCVGRVKAGRDLLGPSCGFSDDR